MIAQSQAMKLYQETTPLSANFMADCTKSSDCIAANCPNQMLEVEAVAGMMESWMKPAYKLDCFVFQLVSNRLRNNWNKLEDRIVHWQEISFKQGW